jgi:hypothetical protein
MTAQLTGSVHIQCFSDYKVRTKDLAPLRFLGLKAFVLLIKSSVLCFEMDISVILCLEKAETQVMCRLFFNLNPLLE